MTTRANVDRVVVIHGPADPATTTALTAASLSIATRIGDTEVWAPSQAIDIQASRSYEARPASGHLLTIDQAADGHDHKASNLQDSAHTLGYRGHQQTKSRPWSTTFTGLRARRQGWRLHVFRIEPESLERRLGEWEYRGIGHLSVGNTRLASSAEPHHRPNRRTTSEET